MEKIVTDISIIAAGCLGMYIAVVHGYLGATKVIRPIKGMHPSAKRILHGIMFLSAVYWFIGGAVLASAPYFLSSDARYIAVLVVGSLYFSGALVNFLGTRGRHFGWVLLTIATALAGTGI
jgi:hypothetical protein